MTVEIVKELNYALLRPKKIPTIPKEAVQVLTGLTVKQAVYFISNLEDLVSFDIETRGVNAALPYCQIVGIGLADSQNILYIDKQSAEPGAWDLVFRKLAEPRFKLFGHNLFFDSAFLRRDFPHLPFNFYYCTYGLFRQLSTEGFDGQTWGLKDAQINLLGWDYTNEGELDKWLVDNKYIAGTPSLEPTSVNLYPTLNEKGQLRYAKPDKGQMWLAPSSILGYYCGVDAASTYLLLNEILLPALAELPKSAQDNFREYHSIFLKNVDILVEQQLYGVNIDTPRLKIYHTELKENIEKAAQDFLHLPDLAKVFSEIKAEFLQKRIDMEPPKYKKSIIPKEPIKFKKDGSLTQAYVKYQEYLKNPPEPEVSKSWLNWKDKLAEEDREYQFNLNSGPALQNLFYNKLEYPVTVITDSGKPATDSSALRFLGSGGKALQVYKDLVKEESYIDTCLEKVSDKNKLYLQFRVPGTLTGRLAGSGGLNVQQLPKSKGYLECWTPRPGHVWVGCDINSLEQVVLTELSQDPALLRLYGPNAQKGNDVYLYNGAQMKGIGEKIRRFYNPEDWTRESIDIAKKECKKERSIAKLITLASSYGAGPDKLYTNMTLDGIDISLAEVQEMHRSYWQIYKGVKEYGQILEMEWEDRGGWVYNGLGRPIGVAEDKKKDLVNRVVQSTGHDILMMIIAELDNLRQRYKVSNKGLVWRPVIVDFHDESIVECKVEDKERVMDMFREAYRIVNFKLNCGVRIEGEPEVLYSLADAKIKE
jgi:DNA polymerase I-like protein with 3'-5' exonuclease and polymerase domains